MLKKFLAAFLFSICAVAKAEIHVETACYSHTPSNHLSKPIQLVVRSYRDIELKKEVGAFFQYNGSKEIIPIAFVKYMNTDEESSGLGNYEISRMEISKNKVPVNMLKFKQERDFVRANILNIQIL